MSIVARYPDDEIRNAHTDGYVACSQCGHTLADHDELGCHGAPGCSCPQRLTAAHLVQILAGYDMTAAGVPMVHYRSISDDAALCGLLTGDGTPHTAEPDYTVVTCPVCVQTGKHVACPRCARPTTDPASHCPACGECDCVDRQCQLGDDRDRQDPPARGRQVRRIEPGARVRLADIVHGCTIWRYTDTTDTGVLAPLPCHGDAARRQTVTVPTGAERAYVICRTCPRSYLLELLEDNDGGHYALFTLTSVPHLLSRSQRS
jgi:hypothetical protein